MGTVCTGIGAPEVACHQLGWQPAWFAEIEPFPCSVLAHHWPAVPNLGDMTALPERVRAREIEAPDVLVGGTPCQAFSVAGGRGSLGDARGNLTLTFVELADAIDDVRADRGEPAGIVWWENVPGVLSTPDNAFGCFLAGLAGCDQPIDPGRNGWANAGVVFGPRRALCWRILDAQYFGLAQRRKRVFVVASARDGFDPLQILLEPEGVRRDSPPRRETREEVAGSIRAGAGKRGGIQEQDNGSGLVRWPAEVACTLNAAFGKKQGLEDQHALGGGSSLCPPPVAMCLNAGGMGRQDAESETLIPTGGYFDVAHSLRGEGFDASEDGTGRGTPLVPVLCGSLDTNRHPSADSAAAGRLVPVAVIDDREQVPVAFAHQAGGAQTTLGFDPDAGTTPTLSCHQTPAIAFMSGAGAKAGSVSASEEFSPTLRSGNGGSTSAPCVTQALGVRRLTPRECERLQGFPDDYTLIPSNPMRHVKRKKLDLDYIKYLARGGVLTFEQCMSAAADGPRYKALGNSMAVPVIHWIGRRIDAQLAADVAEILEVETA